jgi:4-hydroxybenzoate polyprenyltransferase
MPTSTVKQWLKLVRLQSGAATAITAVFGAIILMPKDEINITHLMILFAIGLLFHFYGFTLNEYSDIEIDRYAKELSEKPLVSGTIKRSHALYAALIAVIAALFITIFYFRSLQAILAFLIAVLLGGVYDLCGKKFFGADFILGTSIFFFCLFGAQTVSTELTPVVLSVAFLFFIQLTFQTGITGGMKDIPHDFLAGAKTSPVYLGCRVIGRKLIVTHGFRTYVLGMKAVHTFAIVMIFWLGIIELSGVSFIQIFILTLLILSMWATTIKALGLRTFDRKRLMQLLGAQEIVTYPIVPILIIGMIGFWNALFLLFLPIIWLACFLFIIYGKYMPDV